MKRSAIFCLGIILSGNSFAGCDWATTTPPDDATYKYLVAKSYSETSAADAANKAERDIDNQIGRLFGTALNVQSEFYSDTTTSAGTTRSYERSIGTISLKGLERQKSDVSKESGGWVGCVRYRYSQKEFKQEKQRLANLPKSALENIIFNESVGDTTCKGAPVEIITTPAKAFVTIDNGKYQGESPIKFGNVCNGKHTLEITKENYSNVNETLIVPTNNKISKTLKRETKNIKIRTSLGNSRIFINGVDYGKEPVNFNAQLGIEQKITAKNSEAIDITRTVSFSKYSESEYMFNMEKLPGKIDFSAFKVRNPDVKISVNGKTVTGNTTGELSVNNTQKLVFSKAGFFDIKKSFTINGGKTTYYPSQELEFSKEPRTKTEILVALGMNSDINFSAGIEAALKTRINKFIDFRGAAGLQFERLKVKSTSINYDYYKYEFNPNCSIGHNCENVTFNEYYTPDKNWNYTYYGYWVAPENPIISHQQQIIDWKYNEPFYANLGLVGLKKLYIYGAGAIGFLEGKTTPNKYIPLTDSSFNKTIFRYGAGIQWNITKKIGLRFQYMTTGNKISLPYKINYKTANIGAHYTDSYSDPDYVWLHKGVTKNAVYEENMKALESFSGALTISF